MSGEIGQIIDGKYRLTRLLGQGGMGAVYEGENLRIHRRVAIKMLHGEVSTQAETVTRFEREAQAAGRIGSEHICEVLDLGLNPDGTRYMVMEYLEGETLGARIKRHGRLTPLQAVPLLAQVLDGLEAAHAVGIVHRDLKPDNVWIMPSRGGTKDFVKILDFGVSKFSQAAGGDEFNATRTGSVVGTPYYMSPEQARGMGEIDGRTDVYAIGVVLYQAVTGQVPYQAETFNELLFKIVLEVAPPPQTYVPDLDPEFAGIIVRAMSREPAARYQTCAEFKEALLAYQARGPAARPGQTPPVEPKRGLAAGGTAFMDVSPMPLEGSVAGRGSTQTPSPNAAPPTLLDWAPATVGEVRRPPAVGSATKPIPGGAVPLGPGALLPSTTPPNAAWGNASGAVVGPAPKSKAGLFVGIGAAIVAIGAAVAVMALRAPATSATAEASSATSIASTTPPAPAPTTSASTSPSNEASASASAPAASAAPSAESSVTPSAEPETKPAPTVRKAPRPTPRPPAAAKPLPGRPVTGDLGY